MPKNSPSYREDDLDLIAEAADELADLLSRARWQESRAKEIAQMSPVAVQLAKEAVNRSFETLLDEGLMFERKNFYLTFSSEDQKEGMKAFIEKRKPSFHGR